MVTSDTGDPRAEARGHSQRGRATLAFSARCPPRAELLGDIPLGHVPPRASRPRSTSSTTVGGHIRHILAEYALSYFNTARPHQEIAQRLPVAGERVPGSPTRSWRYPSSAGCITTTALKDDEWHQFSRFQNMDLPGLRKIVIADASVPRGLGKHGQGEPYRP